MSTIHMMSDETQLVDIMANWRLVQKWKDEQIVPRLDELSKGCLVYDRGTFIVVENSIFLKNNFDILEMREWLNRFCVDGYRTAGRFEYTVQQYRVECDLTGFNFQFNTRRDAVLFKLQWF